jgi:hypothetical protein
MSGYYNFIPVRDQIIAAGKNGLCVYKIFPKDPKRNTAINAETWKTDCKSYPCVIGWCQIILDIKIPGDRTRAITIIYKRGEELAYVWLFGTAFEKLRKANILKLTDKDKLPFDERFAETIQNK